MHLKDYHLTETKESHRVGAGNEVAMRRICLLESRSLCFHLRRAGWLPGAKDGNTK